MPDPNNHQDLSRLLPFYLNNSLSELERARIEAGLKDSATLRAELEEHRQLMALVKQGATEWSDLLPQSAPESVVAAVSVPNDQPIRNPMAFLSPANWNPAISLALALAVLTQGGALIWQATTISGLREQNYELASGKDPGDAKGSIIVELKEDSSWNNVVKLFDDEGLSIASSGDFGILILNSDKSGAELQQQIRRLRASPLVSSADPAT